MYEETRMTAPSDAPVVVVILAAGAGARFGGCKQLAPLNGVPLLQRMLDRCRALPDVAVRVVLGAHQPAIRAAIDFSGSEVLDNTHWREGIAASIRLAVATAPARCAGMLFVAADQARLDTPQLQALIRRWRQQPGQIAAATYAGQPGIPALFPRTCFAGLLSLRGDTGARQLLQHPPVGLVTLPMPAAGFDIDTVADLAHCAVDN